MDNLERAQLRELRVAIMLLADVMSRIPNWAPYGDDMPDEDKKLVQAVAEKIKQLP